MFARIKKIDWKLYSAIFLLLGAGLVSLLSTGGDFFYRQLWWIAIGVVCMAILIFADLRSFFSNKALVYGLYICVNIMLLVTLIIAPEIKGNRAWIVIGTFQLQPAEFAKIALILLCAYFFSHAHVQINRLRTLIISFVYTAIPAGLIMLQPDVGSSLILLGIWFGFVLVSGISVKKLLMVVAFFAVLFALAWNVGLQEYQKNRILGVFSPSADPLGSGYNVIQSKIAIGSGGIIGKGFGQGTQSQLGFLPEAQNDFIFSGIAEEGGVLAALIVLFAEFFLVYRCIRQGVILEGNFAKLIAIGAGIFFFLQAGINIGSALGVAPVVGITLPFVSYGGSSIIANLLLVGIIQSLFIRR